MNKYITAAALLAAGTAFADAATLIADWKDFTNLTAGNYTLTTSGSSSVADGVLSVVGGSSGATAKVDLTSAGLTLGNGFSVSMKVSNFTVSPTTNNGNPWALMSLASSDQQFLALLGVNDNTGKFALNGSGSNITMSATANALSSVAGTDPVLVTATFSAGTISLYVGGDLAATGTYTNTDVNTQTISTLGFGSWVGSSNYGRATEKIHSLSVYNGTLTAAEVKALAIPEPSAFGLLAGIGALALVASRRRRAK